MGGHHCISFVWIFFVKFTWDNRANMVESVNGAATGNHPLLYLFY